MQLPRQAEPILRSRIRTAVKAYASLRPQQFNLPAMGSVHVRLPSLLYGRPRLACTLGCYAAYDSCQDGRSSCDRWCHPEDYGCQFWNAYLRDDCCQSRLDQCLDHC